MKKTVGLLALVTMLFSAFGVLFAVDFGKDIKNVKTGLADYEAGARIVVPVSAPMPMAGEVASNTKWWSINLFGSGHKASAKAALKFMNKASFPDMVAAKDILIEGSNDESGHLDPKDNGGKTEELWHGKTPFSKGGVLWNYAQFKFNEAYARLAAICHLTQDQAVPTHAANIRHYTNDSFEGFYGNDVKISAARDNGELEPYAYYQAVQDETRSKLPGWTDPATGLPYWVAAPDAPPLGQDVTYGPWGRYGGRRNRDVYAVPPPQNNDSDGGNNNNPWISARPEIRMQQLAVSGAATVSVLESASKRLPPLVQNLSVSTIPVRAGGTAETGYQVKFNIYENRSPDVTYAVTVYRDGMPAGTAITGAASLFPPTDDSLMFSGAVTVFWAGAADSALLPAGNYVLDARVTDADGNITPDEVNADDISANDTKAAVVIN